MKVAHLRLKLLTDWLACHSTADTWLAYSADHFPYAIFSVNPLIDASSMVFLALSRVLSPLSLVQIFEQIMCHDNYGETRERVRKQNFVLGLLDTFELPVFSSSESLVIIIYDSSLCFIPPGCPNWYRGLMFRRSSIESLTERSNQQDSGTIWEPQNAPGCRELISKFLRPVCSVHPFATGVWSQWPIFRRRLWLVLSWVWPSVHPEAIAGHSRFSSHFGNIITMRGQWTWGPQYGLFEAHNRPVVFLYRFPYSFEKMSKLPGFTLRTRSDKYTSARKL